MNLITLKILQLIKRKRNFQGFIIIIKLKVDHKHLVYCLVIIKNNLIIKNIKHFIVKEKVKLIWKNIINNIKVRIKDWYQKIISKHKIQKRTPISLKDQIVLIKNPNTIKTGEYKIKNKQKGQN